MKSALGLLIKESLSLNRTPVVFAPPLLSSHNFGCEVNTSWGKYIDLDNIAIVPRNGNTTYTRALEREVIAERADAFAVLEVNGKHVVSTAENDRYTLIVKHNPSGLGPDNVYTHADFDFEVGFSPSDAVSRLAGDIIRRLGTYHAIHVRRGDMLADKTRCPNLENDTQPERIRQSVSTVLPKSSRIYVLTNENDPHYFDLLKTDYQVFRYFDFPELKRLVEGNHPDNFFLYEIEQLIFAKAQTKIYTFAHPNGVPRISLTKDVGWT